MSAQTATNICATKVQQQDHDEHSNSNHNQKSCIPQHFLQNLKSKLTMANVNSSSRLLQCILLFSGIVIGLFTIFLIAKIVIETKKNCEQHLSHQSLPLNSKLITSKSDQVNVTEFDSLDYANFKSEKANDPNSMKQNWDALKVILAKLNISKTEVIATKPKAFNLKVVEASPKKRKRKSTTTTSSPTPKSKSQSKPKRKSSKKKSSTPAESGDSSKAYTSKIDEMLKKLEQLEEKKGINPNEKYKFEPITASQPKLSSSSRAPGSKISRFFDFNLKPEIEMSGDRPHDHQTSESNDEFQFEAPSSFQQPPPPPPPPPPPFPPMPLMPPWNMPFQQPPIYNHEPPQQQFAQIENNNQQLPPGSNNAGYVNGDPAQQQMSPYAEQPNFNNQQQHFEQQPQAQAEYTQMMDQSNQNIEPNAQEEVIHMQNGEIIPNDGQNFIEPMQVVKKSKQNSNSKSKFKLRNIFGSIFPKRKSTNSRKPESKPIPVPVPSESMMLVEESRPYPSYRARGPPAYGGGGPPAYEQTGSSMNMGAGPIGGGKEVKINPMGMLKMLMNPSKWANGKLVFGVVLENGIGKRPGRGQYYGK